MKILSISPDPVDEVVYLNAGRKPNQFSHDRLPILKGVVDALPAGLRAIVVAADLQGREPFPNHKHGGPIRLMGEVLPEQLDHILYEHFKIGSLDSVGAILAGDLYTYPDLRGRGGTGDVNSVWRAFADRFKWVAGVAGNHDTFGDQKRPPNLGNIYFMDETRLKIDGLQFAGLSGVIGNTRKNFRRTHGDFINSLTHCLSAPTDILVMHDGPDAARAGCRGISEAREVIERRKPSLVIRGHKHWPIPLVELRQGIQVLNVEATVVVLIDSDTQNSNYS